MRSCRVYRSFIFLSLCFFAETLFSSCDSASISLPSVDQKTDEISSKSRHRPPPRLIGGQPAGKCQWPWHVALLKSNGQFFCGATLVSSNWILTAAHCFDGKPEAEVVYASIGAHNLTASDAVQKVAVTKIIIHEEYDSSGHGINDIALLRLSEPADVTNPCVGILDLPIPYYEPVLNKDCWMIGWGKTFYPNDTRTDVPMQVLANVILNQSCQSKWDKSVFTNAVINSTNICSYRRDPYTSSCQGDSGSPLQCWSSGRFVFAGIQSWGSGSCSKYPSVHMRVSSYLSWIYRNMLNIPIAISHAQY